MTDAVKQDDDTFEDIPEVFREVARTHGREMFALVYNAGMARQAAGVLNDFVEKHRSQHSAHALGVLTQSFNGVSNAFVVKMGWTEELLAHCDRDLQLAAKQQIVVPGSRIILDS